MKIRTDFVTNSSSSSFILAMKDDISDKNKVELMDFLFEDVLGEKVLTPESTEEDIQKVLGEEELEMSEEDIRRILSEGKTIRRGMVEFDCDCGIEDFYIKIWKKLSKMCGDDFEEIDTDLRY